MVTGLTLLHVPSERRRAATLEGTHDTPLAAGEPAGVRGAVRRPRAPQDFSQLDLGPWHARHPLGNHV
jgi:hypothetical protein